MVVGRVGCLSMISHDAARAQSDKTIEQGHVTGRVTPLISRTRSPTDRTHSSTLVVSPPYVARLSTSRSLPSRSRIPKGAESGGAVVVADTSTGTGESNGKETQQHETF